MPDFSGAPAAGIIFCMDRGAELGAKVCDAWDSFAAKPPGKVAHDWDALLRHVFTEILHEDKDAAFDALIWILTTKPNYSYQNVAGAILVRQAIPCTIGLDHFAEIVLHNFEASAKETVNYMTRSFGEEAVVRKVRDLHESELSAAERSNLRLIMYWLKMNGGEAP